MRKTLALAATTAALFGGTAAAAQAQTVVTPDDVATLPENTPPTSTWVFYVRGAATGQFVSGPASPPLGNESFQISTPTGADKGTLFNFDYVGTDLDDVDAMSYWTYRSAGSAQQVAALNLQVDVNGTDTAGGFTTLVFEPVYNTGQGAVVSAQWQDWDALNGGNAIWWSSNPIPGAPNRDTFVPWNTILASNPDAVIVGGVGINQGSGNPALTTAVDAFNFDGTTYDFEVGPTSKDDCKNGGWQGFYKNQGECVSAFASKNK